MAVVRYIARRELMLSVSFGDQVTYTLPAIYAGIGRARAAVSTMRESMAGKRETYYYRTKRQWQVAFYPIDAAEADRLRQFLASVEDGQTFSFAPDGIASTPSPEYRDVQLDPPSFSEAQHGGNQALASFASITVVEVD